MTDSITIVSGLPRSGTSLLMQMLHAGGMPVLSDNGRAADEDNPRGYFELDAVKRTARDRRWLEDASGKVVKVVCPLLYHLPLDRRYRVLFMRRRLEEVVASQRAMLLRQGKTGAGVADARLVELFRNELDRIAAWLAERPCFEVMQVDYGQLVAAPRDWAVCVDRFLGGGWNVDAMASAVDPALYRQRRG